MLVEQEDSASRLQLRLSSAAATKTLDAQAAEQSSPCRSPGMSPMPTGLHTLAQPRLPSEPPLLPPGPNPWMERLLRELSLDDDGNDDGMQQVGRRLSLSNVTCRGHAFMHYAKLHAMLRLMRTSSPCYVSLFLCRRPVAINGDSPRQHALTSRRSVCCRA